MGRVIKDRIVDTVFNRSITTEDDSEWKYLPLSDSVGEVVMSVVNKIPTLDRNQREVCMALASHLPRLVKCLWGDVYSGGHDPTFWKTTPQVLTHRRPAKWGQCWVTVKIFVSLLRFLGIPARPIKIERCLVNPSGGGGIDDVISGRPPLHGEMIQQSLLDKRCRQWNFHLMAEVKLDNVWNVMDVTPLEDVPNKHFYGPVPVSNIKNNVREGPDFDFLWSSIQGVDRTWKHQTFRGEKLFFPVKISFPFPKIKLHGKDITYLYRSKYSREIYYRHHPLFWDGSRWRMTGRGEFTVQVITMDNGSVIDAWIEVVVLPCFIPSPRTDCTVSIVVKNKNYTWTQIVK